MGSIVNFYVTPTTRLEFLIGKQLPYVVLAMINFVTMVLLVITVFGVPLKGSLVTLAVATLITSGRRRRSGCSSRPSFGAMGRRSSGRPS